MKYSIDEVRFLEEKYGMPLQVFDEKRFTDNYHALDQAMKAHYSRYQIAYSFKTNYTPYICKTVFRLGGYAEVVSDMEYEIAKKVGFSDKHIIFNGPEKLTEIEKAFINGCILNVDSLTELKEICRITRQNVSKSFRIGLRVHLNLGHDFVSRFGMDEEDIAEAFQITAKEPNLSIVGLQCHISRRRDLAAWKLRTEIMLELADRFFADVPEYLDLGSGMFGSMDPEFAKQFDYIPSYEEYASVTAGLVAKHYEGKEGPLLFTEPGTTLVNKFVDTLSKVRVIKQIEDRGFAILDASEHTLGETCMLKKLPLTVIPGGTKQNYYDKIDLTGYTCLEQDVLFPEFRGQLAEGDFVIFGNTGGYSNVLKPPFIRPAGSIVVKDLNDEYHLVKTTESYKDILQTYIF